jgi:hypothetical protein
MKKINFEKIENYLNSLEYKSLGYLVAFIAMFGFLMLSMITIFVVGEITIKQKLVGGAVWFFLSFISFCILKNIKE